MAKAARVEAQKLDAAEIKARLDVWINQLTGLGIEGRDKSQSSKVVQRLLSKDQVEALYQVDKMARKVVNLPVDEMFREGFKILIKEDKGNEINDWIWEELERLNALKLAERLFKHGRLYGSACLYYGITGQDKSSDKPLPAGPIPGLDYLFVFDRYQLKPKSQDSELQADLRDSLGFGEPVFYELNIRDAKQKQTFHKSRLLRLDGVTLPYSMAKKNQFWGDSVLSATYDSLRDYRSANATIGALGQDLSIPVFKIQDLVEMVAQADEELFKARIKLMQLMASSLNAIVLRENESYERLSLNATGFSEIMKLLRDRLVADTEIPHTLLFNESPGGSLGGTGVSEKTDWYDTVRSKQNTELTPVLMAIIKMICRQKSGKAKGEIPKGLAIEYNPLMQLTEKEKLEGKKLQSDIDRTYVEIGVYTPEEVAINRFGSGEYSTETQLDMEARGSFEKAEDDTPPEEEEGADAA